MTEAEAIRLATRIAGDFRRAGLPPAIIEAVIVDDCLEESYLDIYLNEPEALILCGRVYSEADYESLITWSVLAREPVHA